MVNKSVRIAGEAKSVVVSSPPSEPAFNVTVSDVVIATST